MQKNKNAEINLINDLNDKANELVHRNQFVFIDKFSITLYHFFKNNYRG